MWHAPLTTEFGSRLDTLRSDLADNGMRFRSPSSGQGPGRPTQTKVSRERCIRKARSRIQPHAADRQPLGRESCLVVFRGPYPKWVAFSGNRFSGLGPRKTNTNENLTTTRQAEGTFADLAARRRQATLGQRILSCGLLGPLPQKTATRHALSV